MLPDLETSSSTTRDFLMTVASLDGGSTLTTPPSFSTAHDGTPDNTPDSSSDNPPDLNSTPDNRQHARLVLGQHARLDVRARQRLHGDRLDVRAQQRLHVDDLLDDDARLDDLAPALVSRLGALGAGPKPEGRLVGGGSGGGRALVRRLHGRRQYLSLGYEPSNQRDPSHLLDLDAAGGLGPTWRDSPEDRQIERGHEAQAGPTEDRR